MTPLVFLIAVLATHRVSRMIAIEEGPFSMFSWIRGKLDADQKTWLGRGISCIACVSFWVAGIIALLIGASWLEWLGIAGGVVVINLLTVR